MRVTTLTLLASSALAAPNHDLAPRQSTQKITVDLTKRYQTIDGFGISAAFQRANLVVNLQEPKQSEVLNLLFNTTTGAGFSILRNGIGSSKTSQNDWMNTILPNCPSTPGVGDLSIKERTFLFFSEETRITERSWYGSREYIANDATFIGNTGL